MGKKSPKVNLSKRVKTGKGWRYHPVVWMSGYHYGRIKADVVVVDGKEEKHPEGDYHLDWNDPTHGRQREPIGMESSPLISPVAKAQKAVEAWHQKQQELDAQAAGLIGNVNDTPLNSAITDFLKVIQQNRKPGTYAAYKKALEYFQQCCGDRETLSEITRDDLRLRYTAFLREKKHKPRSIYNNFAIMVSFLKANGIRLAEKGDWIKYTQREPETYESHELERFFKACTERERVIFQTFLKTGLREQEVTYLTWDDLNLSNCTVSVRYKHQYGWSPKAYKEREVPIPNDLVESLKEWKKHKKCELVFPTDSCKPEKRFLTHAKVIAKRAGCNPKKFWLHKFRSTFATHHLQHGVDLRTVQSWLGHTDLASTVRYLKPARGIKVQQQVTESWKQVA